MIEQGIICREVVVLCERYACGIVVMCRCCSESWERLSKQFDWFTCGLCSKKDAVCWC